MLSDEELIKAFADGDELSLSTFPTIGPAIRRVEAAVLDRVEARLLESGYNINLRGGNS